MTPNEYATAEHALRYLASADRIPHRTEGEAVLLDLVPRAARRILDLGTGDGRLLSLLLIDRPDAHGVALDFSPTMLAAARERFRGAASVEVVEHDLEETLPDLGPFDAVVSSFAIHHCTDERKRSLYGEVFSMLRPGGVFATSSTSPRPRPRCTSASCGRSGPRPRTRIPRTGSPAWSSSCSGCGRSGSRRWTATGSGWSWPSSAEPDRRTDARSAGSPATPREKIPRSQEERARSAWIKRRAATCAPSLRHCAGDGPGAGSHARVGGLRSRALVSESAVGVPGACAVPMPSWWTRCAQ